MHTLLYHLQLLCTFILLPHSDHQRGHSIVTRNSCKRRNSRNSKQRQCMQSQSVSRADICHCSV